MSSDIHDPQLSEVSSEAEVKKKFDTLSDALKFLDDEWVQIGRSIDIHRHHIKELIVQVIEHANKSSNASH